VFLDPIIRIIKGILEFFGSLGVTQEVKRAIFYVCFPIATKPTTETRKGRPSKADESQELQLATHGKHNSVSD
jgi:hypothetical protein